MDRQPTRRSFLNITAGAMCTGPLAAMQRKIAPARKPNIVVILADDLGYGELSCQGNPEIPTPNIDSIARNGVRFTDGYVTAPVCCPSRAGLMTGRYQTRFGHELNAIGLQNKLPGVGLPLSETTLASTLKSAGYATGMTGKWHLGGSPQFHPQQRGFDEFFGFLHEGHFYVPPPYAGVSSHLRNPEPPYDEENPILRGTQPTQEKEYLTNAFTREAVSFIEKHKQHPFFLYVPFNAIHSPMQALEPYLNRFTRIEDLHRRIFAAMLAALDEGVGRILAKLRESGLEDNTLIFFLSDNGGPTAELTSNNKPLRGGKGQLFEGGIRIPFMVQWKGRLRPGQIRNDPVISLDIFATAAAAAGATTGRAVDGVDLMPYLAETKKAAPHETLFWRYGQNAALRKGNWKLVRQGGRNAAETKFELYDLSNDIGETVDLSAKRPEIVRELTAAWNEKNSQMKAPLWGGRVAAKK